MIFLKTLIGCVNEGATFPSRIHWIRRGEGGLFIILEVVFRSVQAFRSNQTNTFQWQWHRDRGRGRAPGYDFKLSELMTTTLTVSVVCLCKLWLDERKSESTGIRLAGVGGKP